MVCPLNKLTLDLRGVSTVRAGIAVRRPVRPRASNRKIHFWDIPLAGRGRMAGGGDAGPPGVVEEPRLRAGRWAGARGWIEDFSTAPGAQPTAFVLDRSFVGWEFGWGRAMGSRLDGRGPGNRSGAGGTAAGAPTTPFLDAVLRAAGRSSGEVKIARRRCTARCPPLQAVPVFHRHRRHRRGVRYLVRDRDGVHWCTLVLPSTAVSSMRGSGSAGWPTWLEPRRF